MQYYKNNSSFLKGVFMSFNTSLNAGNMLSHALTYFIVRTAINGIAENRTVDEMKIHNTVIDSINKNFGLIECKHPNDHHHHVKLINVQ
jgi:hypothetical protein